MHITSEQKRLSLAIQDLSACEHLQSSVLRNAAHKVLTLLFEQLLRNRKISLSRTTSPRRKLQIQRPPSALENMSLYVRAVGCWLETKKNIKWGGPLCGYFDPNRTLFILDLSMPKSYNLRQKFARFDATLRASVIKTWGCLGWSPLTTWFKEALFGDMDSDGSVDWVATRKLWKNPSFQVFARHIRTNMSVVELQVPSFSSMPFFPTLVLSKISIHRILRSTLYYQNHGLYRGRLQKEEF
jgi:hypothetical protein